ncbi:hypothetical protein DEIPH_ctg060orf0023 [Deinococcus phoenicis]|uniref:Conjugal transfer protein TrbC n=1 Tax=Deinococcus phoenicis TaxID=1476583 RepID=A0A016QME1_9DEIO|nr:hypothetical protein [Deinococcus phoenicis]EYB66944.1 hypothetical protein DEIPH_ctg060orf0023 [Deinococcus phoenicis]
MTEALRLKKAAFMLYALSWMGSALAQATGGTANTPEGIFTKLGCALVRVLSGPGLVAVAVIILVLIFGWNKLAGDVGAFQSFKSGILGAVIILAGGAVVASVFGGACGIGA